MALTVCTWIWGTKYSWEYVYRLERAVKRNLKVDHEFRVFSPDSRDNDLVNHRDGCYSRLRMFDPEWQDINRVRDKVVCLDLDLVVTDQLDSLFNRPESFMILHGGHFNPCPFNGSVMMIERGAHPEVWTDFNLSDAEAISVMDGNWRGTDQTWIAWKVPKAKGWTFNDGIYAYQKPGWPFKSDALPKGAKIVAFPGKKDPLQLIHLPWVSRNWI